MNTTAVELLSSCVQHGWSHLGGNLELCAAEAAPWGNEPSQREKTAARTEQMYVTRIMPLSTLQLPLQSRL